MHVILHNYSSGAGTYLTIPCGPAPMVCQQRPLALGGMGFYDWIDIVPTVQTMVSKVPTYCLVGYI